MIDLARPKTPLDSAKIAGYMAVMSSRGERCPFPASDPFGIAFKEGVALAKAQPKFKKGEMFDLGHYTGLSASVCFDDIEIGDPIVMICKMYGLMVQAADHDPRLVRGELTRIAGKREGTLIYADNGKSTTMFKTDALLGGWHQSFALRWVG